MIIDMTNSLGKIFKYSVAWIVFGFRSQPREKSAIN
jgi:hypothetical protein